MVQAAELYLRIGQCSPDQWLGQQLDFFPAQVGYRALLLLARLHSAALSGLDPQVWREWAPAIIDWPATVNGASRDDKLLLLQRARVRADAELRDALADRYMLDTGTTHGLYIVLWFDIGWWKPDQGTSDRNRVARLDRAQVLQDLRRQAAILADDGLHVEVVMLDMSYERPARESP
jgi:hypothetical protein